MKIRIILATGHDFVVTLPETAAHTEAAIESWISETFATPASIVDWKILPAEPKPNAIKVFPLKEVDGKAEPFEVTLPAYIDVNDKDAVEDFLDAYIEPVDTWWPVESAADDSVKLFDIYNASAYKTYSADAVANKRLSVAIGNGNTLDIQFSKEGDAVDAAIFVTNDNGIGQDFVEVHPYDGGIRVGLYTDPENGDDAKYERIPFSEELTTNLSSLH